MYYSVLPSYDKKSKDKKNESDNVNFGGLLSMLKSK